MKTLFFITISCLTFISSKAQILNQDAEGKSSLIYQGGNIGLDIAKSRLSFTYNNLGYSPSKQLYIDNRYVWGVNASGENKESVANLFSKGDIVPQAQLNGIFGWRWRKEIIPHAVLVKRQNYYVLRIQNTAIIQNLNERKDTSRIRKEEIRDSLKRFEEQQVNIEKEIATLNSLRKRRVIMPYIKIGRSAMAFKLAEANADTTGFSKVFNKNKFEGNFAGIGFNYEIGAFLLGGYIEAEHLNNFSQLDQVSFTITTTETKGKQTQESKQEVSAYSGHYVTYDRTNYYFDILYFQSLPEANYIAWNFYYRYRNSGNLQITPSYTDIGLGAYFFNKSNKFLGGVYVEAPDFFQDIEKSKEYPNLRELQNRLTFGVVARINFSSIL